MSSPAASVILRPRRAYDNLMRKAMETPGECVRNWVVGCTYLGEREKGRGDFEFSIYHGSVDVLSIDLADLQTRD